MTIGTFTTSTTNMSTRREWTRLNRTAIRTGMNRWSTHILMSQMSITGTGTLSDRHRVDYERPLTRRAFLAMMFF